MAQLPRPYPVSYYVTKGSHKIGGSVTQAIIPDISKWNDKPDTPQTVDFVKMRKKAPGVIVKSSQGNWADPCFERYWTESKAAGLLRGAYHFYDERYTPKRQAETVQKLIMQDPPEIRLWLDLEPWISGPYRYINHYYDFLENLKVLVPNLKLGIYTNYYYFREKIWEIHKNNKGKKDRERWLKYFSQYPLWLAWYGSKPQIPEPWKTYMIWQQTSNGNGPEWGSEGADIDLSLVPDWEALCSAS